MLWRTICFRHSILFVQLWMRDEDRFIQEFINFQAGEDYDYYGDMEELNEKVEFYLKNPQIREKIAVSGYEKIGKFFNYDERLDDIIRLVKEN